MCDVINFILISFSFHFRAKRSIFYHVGGEITNINIPFGYGRRVLCSETKLSWTIGGMCMANIRVAHTYHAPKKILLYMVGSLLCMRYWVSKIEYWWPCWKEHHRLPVVNSVLFLIWFRFWWWQARNGTCKTFKRDTSVKGKPSQLPYASLCCVHGNLEPAHTETFS